MLANPESRMLVYSVTARTEAVLQNTRKKMVSVALKLRILRYTVTEYDLICRQGRSNREGQWAIDPVTKFHFIHHKVLFFYLQRPYSRITSNNLLQFL